MKTGQGAVPLIPTNKKGPGGSASFAQQGRNLIVTLALPTALATNAQASIVNGSCSSQTSNGASSSSSMASTQSPGTYKLTVGSNQPAQTTLNNVSLTSLTSSPHSIVVKSATSTLCGDVANIVPNQRP